jgi:hypothetical protein
MRFKDCAARVKASDDADIAAGADAGTFEAIVSVFDNVDHVGDVVRPGAFTDTLAAWKASGDPIPLWWSHRMDDPSMNIGAVADAAELEPGDERIPEWADQWVKDHGGLWIKGQIDTGPEASDKAVATHRLLKSRRVTQFSYAYDVEDEGTDDDGNNELRKLRLYEVSPTPIGANELTELVSAKAAGMKAGRVLSAKNESTIREAVELLTGVLAALDDGNAAEGEPAKREEPHGAKREEPAGLDASTVRLHIDLAELEAQVA